MIASSSRQNARSVITGLLAFAALALSLPWTAMAAIPAAAVAETALCASAAPQKKGAAKTASGQMGGPETADPAAEEGQDAPADARSAEPIAVKASVSPSTVKLGEPFTIAVEIVDRAGLDYAPARDFSLGADADVMDVKAERKDAGDGTVSHRFAIKASMFKLGDVQLPSMKFTASDGESQLPLSVDGVTVTCQGELSAGDEASPMDILPPVSVSIPSYLVIWVFLGVLAAIALGFLGVRAWKRFKARPKKSKAGPPPDPLDVRALKSLHALREEALPDQGLEREMFFRLSEIERGYIGERYGFGALNMTTDELLAELRRLHTPGLDFQRLEDRCREGDFVRYAKAPVPASDCKRAIEDAIELVKSTTAAEGDRAARTPSTSSTGATTTHPTKRASDEGEETILESQLASTAPDLDRNDGKEGRP